ncbi:hypothetical protein QTP86_023914 [Hemibagrus guttatus]|nr:hypothetical protein QTP86_023914 [Hemibagrus guttatus]
MERWIVLLGKTGSEEDKNTAQWIKEKFGKRALCCTIIVFTHIDQLGEKTLDDCLAESTGLRRLLKSCGNRYHAFNNKDSSPSQVEELMQKIENMFMMIDSSYYTAEMYAQENMSAGEIITISFTAAAGITATAGLLGLGFLIRKL